MKFEEMNKEQAKAEFLQDIKKAWTWERLTEREKEKFLKLAEQYKPQGTARQTWARYMAIYNAFLEGAGYKPIGWRE